ncbi:helix-turn-helix transcriptional regulator [uncultured Alteromonas sp.]|uniref:helix-turn-helix domain-containing protein n=1 Tax=uncultured Alteromonas sp. TaxID=179113 RepID=UPI0030D9D2B2
MKNNDINRFVDIVNAIGEPEFCQCLLAYLQNFIEFDSASAIHYRKDHVPELLYADLTPSEQNIFHARFLHGAYVASPAYQAYMHHAESGVYPWHTLMPEGFKDSQMYETYYRPSCIEDLLYLFVDCGQLGYVQLSVGRSAPNPLFESADIEVFKAVSDILIGLLKKHLEMSEFKHIQQAQPLSSLVLDRVNMLLDNFEPDLLTKREQQIAKLVIMGHSSQSAADILCISPGTERVHRAKLYAKMSLRSNSELFSYFLDKLTQESDGL